MPLKKDPAFFRDSLFTHGSAVKVRKGDRLLLEGCVPDSVYYILSGKVRVGASSEMGREFLFAELGPDRFLGVSHALTGAPCPYSACVAEEGDVLRIPRGVFEKLLEDIPGLSRHLNYELALEHNIIARRLKSMVFHSVEERLARYLGKRFSLDATGGPAQTLGLHFTREELSSVLGSTRESISRSLGSLARRGGIQINGKIIKLVSREKLLPSENS